jgi:ectoine hydroxylase-related dioxygenase (phytanoyl-CoA dioxygenase family)
MNTTTQFQVTPDQRRQFADNGYFVTPPLFDTATLDGVQSEFQRMWDEDIAKAERTGNPKDAEFARLKPFFAFLEKRSPTCAAFCRHPQLVAIAQQMLGGELDMTWNQAIVKPPSQGKAFAWHQDGWYAVNNDHAKDADKSVVLGGKSQITFWIAITRTTIENGTLWVVPTMHKQGLLPHVWSEENREWQCQFDSSGKIPCELRRGQVLVFMNLVPHCSGPNVSQEVRMAYQIGYGIPGVLKNNYQQPVMRGGKLV